MKLLERVCSVARSDEAVLSSLLQWIPEAPENVVAWLASRLRALKHPAVEAAGAELLRRDDSKGFCLLPEEDPSPAACEVLLQLSARGMESPLASSALQRLPAAYLESGLPSWDADLRLEATRELITKAPSGAHRDQILVKAFGDQSPSIQDLALELVGNFGLEGPERDAVIRWLWGRLNDPDQLLNVRCKAGLVLEKLK
jgi:hypothetical protein